MITIERLKERLSYDPDTGRFTWLIKGGAVKSLAKGSISHGHIRITIDGKFYYAHRLAWFFVNEVWPKNDIDHINGIRDDNRMVNLREATRSENLQNQRVSRTNNKGSFLGVSLYKSSGKWRAQIRHEGKVHHIGYFDNPELCSQAYLARKRTLHPFSTI